MNSKYINYWATFQRDIQDAEVWPRNLSDNEDFMGSATPAVKDFISHMAEVEALENRVHELMESITYPAQFSHLGEVIRDASVWDTGGNCQAYVITAADKSYHVMITEQGGANLPKLGDQVVCIGLYQEEALSEPAFDIGLGTNCLFVADVNVTNLRFVIESLLTIAEPMKNASVKECDNVE